MIANQIKPNHIYLIYMYKNGLALNNLQGLICYDSKPNQKLFLTEDFDFVHFKEYFFGKLQFPSGYDLPCLSPVQDCCLFI